MNELNIKGKQHKNDKNHSYKGKVDKIADNILNREFTDAQPFEKLTSDVTEFKICKNKMYLSPIMELYNREIALYSISFSPNLWHIREMLGGLFKKLPDNARLLFHFEDYQRLLSEHNRIQSISRKGNGMDNGAMENFFEKLKVERFYGENLNALVLSLKN